jgi:hypothetical protein
VAGQFKVDEIMSRMTPERRSEFLEFCQFNPSSVAIAQYLNEQGYEVSQDAAWRWQTARRRKGEKAVIIGDLASQFEGSDPVAILNTIAGMATYILSLQYDVLREPKDLSVLASLMREARSAAAQASEIRYIKDRRELESASAFGAMQELIALFENEPWADALREGAKAVMARRENS